MKSSIISTLILNLLAIIATTYLVSLPLAFASSSNSGSSTATGGSGSSLSENNKQREKNRNGQGHCVGVSRKDLTSSVTGVGLMGYANPDQTSAGIHMRIRARAFVIGDSNCNDFLAIVNVDAGMSSHILVLEVLEKLQIAIPNVFTFNNLCITGTHTHSAPGGFLSDVLYQIASQGYVQETFNTMVNAISSSIIEAYKTAKAGSRIRIGQTLIENANINRSPSAYRANPESERNQYKGNTDKEMTLVRIDDQNGKPIGQFNIFSVHGTSMPCENLLISGDNKGYAAQAFEHLMEPNRLPGQESFVAGFISTNLGDVSPNINGTFCSDTGAPCEELHSTCSGRSEKCHGRGPGRNPIESVAIIGGRQVAGALNVFNEKNGATLKDLDTFDIDYRHSFMKISNYQVHLPDGKNVTTCRASMGYAFAAGTTDGPGMFDFIQGTTKSNKFWNFVRNLIHKPSKQLIDCQAPKPILLATGETNVPYEWDPSVVPIQLFRIGNKLALVSVSGELTTMSGRRLRNAVREELVSLGLLDKKDGIVTLIGLANGYSSYVTTYEEFQIQRYEGASTLYGPHTLDAYIQEARKLARSMAEPRKSKKNEELPADNRPKLITFVSPPGVDKVCENGLKFGDVTQQPKEEYKFSASKAYTDPVVITAKFTTGNPRHDSHSEGTFLTVERLVKRKYGITRLGADKKRELLIPVIEDDENHIIGTAESDDDDEYEWETIANDSSFDTFFKWEKEHKDHKCSIATIEWHLHLRSLYVDNRGIEQTGTYRITHYGDAMLQNGGRLKSFKGSTRPFRITIY